MKNSKIAYQLKKEFTMNADEISFLAELPSNLPETKLTKKQIDRIAEIYYKYISNKVVRGWGQDLAEFEQKEKWPSGNRVKRHEAQRFILEWLSFENTSNLSMDSKKAAKHFFAHLQTREAYQILIRNIFEEVR